MKSKALIVGILAVVLALGAVWYFASPGYAMKQLRDAAVEGEKSELEERIDFESLRDNLKSDFKAQMATKMASGENEGLEALGAAMAMAMIDPMIDGFVTPETMSEMVKGGKFENLGENKVSEPASSQTEEMDWKIDREGFSRFVASPTTEEGEDGPKLIFERDGFGWKLIELEMPNNLLEGMK